MSETVTNEEVKLHMIMQNKTDMNFLRPTFQNNMPNSILVNTGNLPDNAPPPPPPLLPLAKVKAIQANVKMSTQSFDVSIKVLKRIQMQQFVPLNTNQGLALEKVIYTYLAGVQVLGPGGVMGQCPCGGPRGATPP